MLTEGQTNRETDMTNLLVAFLNFAKAPKNWRVNFYFSRLATDGQILA
jgi:hypothetical protein